MVNALPDPTEAASALTALAEGRGLGPFFAVSTQLDPATDWRDLTELCRDEVLAERVQQLRAKVGRTAGNQVPERVAASVLSLGIFARVISPLMGAALTRGILPNVNPLTLWWQPVSEGLLPVAMIPSGTSWNGDPRTADGQRSLAATFESAVLEQLVDPLVRAFRRQGVSPVVLRGNVVSAVGGALTMLDGTDGGGWSVLRVLVTQPYLLDSAVFIDGGMRRRSCCMVYRVPGTGYCGDCVLAT